MEEKNEKDFLGTSSPPQEADNLAVDKTPEREIPPQIVTEEEPDTSFLLQSLLEKPVAQTEEDKNTAQANGWLEHTRPAIKTTAITWIILTLLYAVGVAVRYYFALQYSANPCIMPDENLYAALARSIFDDFSLFMRGQPLTYNNILYPLLLTPFYGFSPELDVYRSAELLNCFLMNLAIFPAYFIAKRFIQNRWLILVVCAGSLLLPDMIMTMRDRKSVV